MDSDGAAERDAGPGLAVRGRPYGALASLPDYAADPPPVLLTYDEMRNRGASGTSPWTRYEVTIPAPPGVLGFWLGVRHDGVGTAWFDEFEVGPLLFERLDGGDAALLARRRALR